MGDQAVIVSFGNTIDPETHRFIKTFTAHLHEHPFPGLIECVPAFTTVTVYYDPGLWIQENDSRLPYDHVCETVETILTALPEQEETAARFVEIPVCYGGELGPDLEFVAQHNGLSSDEVIRIHCEGRYLVYMIGFSPGFPYLGGLSEKIAAPRRSSPRLVIPAGSVGIAGQQTGIYPIATPGGWQLIGRTPLSLFRPNMEEPSLLQAGDIIRFCQISEDEFKFWMD
nr:5-oxoprolinase subunit PxpB [Ammoniphilus resinae]